MTNVVPGFVWHPIDVAGRAKRAKGRGLVAHVAVSESANLVPPGTPATRSADWHFYLPKSGPGIQYIDLDYQCWSSAGANATCPAFESQGGVNSPQTEPWTANQIELAAQILAHLHKTEGTPLQLMPNSLPGSKGLAPHRMGISPWRVAGGEVWSSSNGKVCPGDAKVAQLPQVVARATQLVNGKPTPTPSVQEDDMRMIQQTDRGIAVVGPGYVQTLTPGQVSAAVQAWGNPVVYANAGDFDAAVAAATGGGSLGDLHGKIVDSRLSFSDREGGKAPDADDMLGHILSTRAEVADLAAKVAKVQTGGVDVKQVAALVLAGIKAQMAADVPPAPGA